jgi:HPt (histidine-containing phosphotransfer) domain-containing protein
MKNEEAQIGTLLANLWERSLPTLHERLNILDRAALEGISGNLSETSRIEALNVAHKLSGTLGMFGRHQGTEIAREMEQLLSAPIPAAALPRLVTLAASLRQALFPN